MNNNKKAEEGPDWEIEKDMRFILVSVTTHRKCCGTRPVDQFLLKLGQFGHSETRRKYGN